MTETLLLRPEEAARELGIGRSKTYDLLRRGEIPSIRIGRSVRVHASKLREWIERQTSLNDSPET